MTATRGRRLAAATAAFAALAIVAGASGQGPLAAADRTLSEAVKARRTPAKTVLARRVSGLAEPSVIYPVLAAGAAARRVGWRRAGLACLVTVTGAQARRQLSKLIARPRPPAPAWLAVPEGYSFPSKHTTVAALAAGAGVRAFGVQGGPALAAPLLAAACIGASRIYLGVHWPTDVVAGWLFAEGWLRLTECAVLAKDLAWRMTFPQAPAHSFRATSGPVMRARRGKVPTRTARAATIPAVVSA